MTTVTGSSVLNRAKSIAVSAMNGGAASKFFSIFMGRCTFFAIIFSIVGLYGWLVLARDLTSYALFVTAIQGLLVLHSWKSDIMELKQVQQNVTVVTPPNQPSSDGQQ